MCLFPLHYMLVWYQITSDVATILVHVPLRPYRSIYFDQSHLKLRLYSLAHFHNNSGLAVQIKINIPLRDFVIKQIKVLE